MSKKKRVTKMLTSSIYCSNKAPGKRKKNKRKRKIANLKKQRESFYFSDEWRKLRYKSLLMHGKKCQCCGASSKESRLHVDHIKPRIKYPSLELEIDNLQVLCEDCNLGKGAWDETDHRK